MSPPVSSSGTAPSAIDEVRQRLRALHSPLEMLEEIFLRAPVGLQLCHRDGSCALVNPMHTQLFGAVPPRDYNIFEDTVLAKTGVDALVRRAFQGERMTVPPIWYDARELQNVKVEQARRFAVGAELVPLRTGGDEVTHVLFVFNDVTETHHAREAAEAAADVARAEKARAEEAAARAEFLAEAARVLTSTLDYERTLHAVARLATPVLGDFCIVDVVESDGRVQRVAAVHADPEAQAVLDELWKNYTPEQGSRQPARRVIESGEPELLPVVDSDVIAGHTQDLSLIHI